MTTPVGALTQQASSAPGSETSASSGLSYYQIWLMQPGNAGKTVAQMIDEHTGQPGPSGKSAYELWLELPANEGGSVQDYFNSMQGMPGLSGYTEWAMYPGNEGKTYEMYLEAITGPAGFPGPAGYSAFDLWQQQPGNATKTYDDFLAYQAQQAATELATGLYQIPAAAIEQTQELQMVSAAKILQWDGATRTYVKNTPAEMLAIANPLAGEKCIVRDDGDGKPAGYWYDGSAWLKSFDPDWANVTPDWGSITGKPTSTPAQIDNTITEFATHKNNGDIHFSAIERTKLNGIAESATKTEQSATNGNVKINGVEKTVYTHPETHPASIIQESAEKQFISQALKESIPNKLDKTLTQNKVWVGSAMNEAEEFPVYDEWVTAEPEQIGQKFDNYYTVSMKSANNRIASLEQTLQIPIGQAGRTGGLPATAVLDLVAGLAGYYLLPHEAWMYCYFNSGYNAGENFVFSIGNNSSTFNNVVASTSIPFANFSGTGMLQKLTIASTSPNQMLSADALKLNITGKNTNTLHDFRIDVILKCSLIKIKSQ